MLTILFKSIFNNLYIITIIIFCFLKLKFYNFNINQNNILIKIVQKKNFLIRNQLNQY